MPKFGFSGLCLVAAIVIFAIQQGCSMTGNYASWFWGAVWFVVASAFVIAAIWSWDKTAGHHWVRKTLLTIASLLLMGMFTYDPLAKQYAREHTPLPSIRDRLVVNLAAVLLSSDRETSGGFWALRQDYVAPVNMGALVSIENITDSPISIKDFRLLGKDGRTGEWVTMAIMDAPARLYCCDPILRAVREVQLDGGGLLEVLRRGPIPPHTQILNWVMYEYPKGYDPSSKMSKFEVFPYGATKEQSIESADEPVGGKPQGAAKREIDKLMVNMTGRPLVTLNGIKRSHFAEER